MADEVSPIDKIQGTYTHRFMNKRVDGTPYRSNNLLEILKLSPTTAYFNTHLDWAYGHQCDLSGVAELQDDGSLVYRKNFPLDDVFMEKPDGTLVQTQHARENHMCIFTIRPTDTGVKFEDIHDMDEQPGSGGVCRQVSCGSRGGYNGVEFKNTARKSIRAQTIKRSRDFKEAMENHQQAKAPGVDKAP